MTDSEKQGYIDAVKAASTGPTMRAPISNALRAFWNDSIRADKLGGLTAEAYVPQEYFNEHSKVDSVPAYNSENMVSSGGVFAATGDLENINWEV